MSLTSRFKQMSTSRSQRNILAIVVFVLWTFFCIWNLATTLRISDEFESSSRLLAYDEASATLYFFLLFVSLFCLFAAVKGKLQLVRLAFYAAILATFICFSIEVAGLVLVLLLENDIISSCKSYILSITFPNITDDSSCQEQWELQSRLAISRCVVGIILFILGTYVLYRWLGQMRRRQADEMGISLAPRNNDAYATLSSMPSTIIEPLPQSNILPDSVHGVFQKAKNALNLNPKVALSDGKEEQEAKDKESILPYQEATIINNDIPIAKYSLPPSNNPQENKSERDHDDDLGNQVIAHR